MWRRFLALPSPIFSVLTPLGVYYHTHLHTTALVKGPNCAEIFIHFLKFVCCHFAIVTICFHFERWLVMWREKRRNCCQSQIRPRNELKLVQILYIYIYLILLLALFIISLLYIFIYVMSSWSFQNTYTNADKLLEAAEQLAQTGECDPEEIYKAARHLEVRIQDFVRRVEHRKLLLDMSVSFHTHTKEVGLTNILRYPAAACGFYLNEW